jgi:hypothetical protein
VFEWEGKSSPAGGQFWLRIVVESDGERAKALSVPLTSEFEIPLDWQSEEWAE